MMSYFTLIAYTEDNVYTYFSYKHTLKFYLFLFKNHFSFSFISASTSLTKY